MEGNSTTIKLHFLHPTCNCHSCCLNTHGHTCGSHVITINMSSALQNLKNEAAFHPTLMLSTTKHVVTSRHFMFHLILKKYIVLTGSILSVGVVPLSLLPTLSCTGELILLSSEEVPRIGSSSSESGSGVGLISSKPVLEGREVCRPPCEPPVKGGIGDN